MVSDSILQDHGGGRHFPGVGHAQKDTADSQSIRHFMGPAVQTDDRTPVLFIPDFNGKPEGALPLGVGQSLDHRFLGGEAGGEMFSRVTLRQSSRLVVMD